MNQNCFCGHSSMYIDCCGAIHSGKRNAQTAQDLMRSRYSAFVTADVDYILKTYASKTRPIQQREEILEWALTVEWRGLKILSAEKGEENDLIGWVEFQASYCENGEEKCIHEKSLFERENGAWVYVSGEYPERKIEKQINRNDLCFCGSGRKFKKCCMNK
ncbi:YchJ family protein [Labilibaculum sp.]|uniref:YchJ family protein n=1 Tax=Labilibaculum sp. TaxID=2060723 RepID=UPI0035687A2E